MVPSFLYDRAKSALPSTPLPSNPSWSTVLISYGDAIQDETQVTLPRKQAIFVIISNFPDSA